MKIFSIFLFISFSSKAFLVSNDANYFIYHTSSTSYILTEKDYKYLPHLLAKSQQALSMYDKEFHWVLDERMSLIVTSNRNQIANAFATSVPNNMTVFYKGGVEFLDESATSSWIDTLSSHEISHVYQLNVKNKLGSTLKPIFGNQPFVILPLIPLPIFISPTLLLPTFLLEGNAVLNESKLSQGGRLFSAYSLTLASELVNSGQADLKFIMNNHLEFPYGTDKYIVGGYFQASLAEKYEFSIINGFYRKHAENNINPFDLKYSFAATFFADYEVLYSRFLNNFKETQKDYRPYKGPDLVTSVQNIEFTRIEDSIYFLSSEDGKSPKKLNQYDVNTGKIQSRSTDLKSGKVFRIGNKFVTATSYNDNSRNIFYTLLDEDYNPDDTYSNKYVTDINGSFVSYFDMNDSFDKGALYRNQEKIANTESKARLDAAGNIYYFKQEGEEKRLYKNSEKLFFLRNHFALITDIISDREIYFISGSKNGSSLFCYCSGNLEKVLPYDNIISAIKTPDGFLISYLTSTGYRVALVADNTRILEEPISSHAQFSKKYFPSLEAPELPVSSSSFDPYFSFRELRFSKYAMDFQFSKNYGLLLNSLSWVDPLFYSNVDLTFSISDQIAYNSLSLDYSPYATKLMFNLTNETDVYSPKALRITTNSFQFGSKTELFSKKFHSASLGFDFEFEKNNLFENDITTLYLNYQYLNSYFLNYRPYSYFTFTPYIEKSGSRTSQSYQASAGRMLLRDLYFSFGFSKIDSEYFKLESNLDQKRFFKRGLNSPVYLASLYTSKMIQGDCEILYEIHYSKYYYRFPFSLRRLAPFVGFQKNQSEEFFYGTEIEDVSFGTVGLEAELLAFHNNPFRIRLFSTEVKIQEHKETRFSLIVRSGF